MINAVVTVLGLGYLRPGPGTITSFICLIPAVLLHGIINSETLILVLIILYLVGLFSVNKYITDLHSHDPQEVVIDEVLGQWIAILPIYLFLSPYGSTSLFSYISFWVLAFSCFRFFDILKPWPISLADRRTDAFGVMLDDVIAGMFSGLIVSLNIYIWN